MFILLACLLLAAFYIASGLAFWWLLVTGGFVEETAEAWRKAGRKPPPMWLVFIMTLGQWPVVAFYAIKGVLRRRFGGV